MHIYISRPQICNSLYTGLHTHRYHIPHYMISNCTNYVNLHQLYLYLNSINNVN